MNFAFPYLIFIALLLAGYIFSQGLGVTRYKLLTSNALGLGFSAICIAVTGVLNLDWPITIALFLILLLVSLVIAIKRKPNISRHHFRLDVGLLIVIAAYGIYYSVIDAYDLVPSDALRHLERLQFALADINDGANNWQAYRTGFNDYYLYYLMAFVWKFSGLNLSEYFFHASLISNLVFLSGLYLLTKAILSSSQKQSSLIAIMACSFFVLHQGFAAFPYLRYYALSATLWMMPIYFLFLLLARDLFETKLGKIGLTLILILPAIASLYHQQETMFMMVMISILLLFYTISAYFHMKKNPLSQIIVTPSQTFFILAMLLISAIMLYLIMTSWIIHALPRHYIDPVKLFRLSESAPLMSKLYILNPNNQFSKVIGLWGFVVYAYAIFYYRQLLPYSLLICGLLLPIFTIFNPVFVDLFLRLTSKAVLYRFTYAIPFSITAALLLVHLTQSIPGHPFTIKLKNICLIGILIATLMPIKSSHLLLQYNRLTWLGSIAKNQSLRNWSDLSHYIERNLPRQIFHTDPVTAYMVRATTSSYSPGYKFFAKGLSAQNLKHYNAHTLSPYRDEYLIINLREGGLSMPGEISQHWPPNILLLSRHYSGQLIAFVDSKPPQLKLLWAQDKIRIYKIL